MKPYFSGVVNLSPTDLDEAHDFIDRYENRLNKKTLIY